MSSDANLIRQRLTIVRRELYEGALRHGRDPDSVRLIAVSKGHPVTAIVAAADAGQVDFGESYLQEALPKLAALQARNLTWHYIGQLQSNKTRSVAEQFHWAHTIDRDKIANRLSEQRPHYAPPLQLCIQVKLAGEAGKGGIAPHAVLALAQHIVTLPRLKLRGLMCIPPPQTTFAAQLQQFQVMRSLLEQLNSELLPEQQLDTLSMGMSDDHDAAIAAGATLVRIGTAVFGERMTNASQ